MIIRDDLRRCVENFFLFLLFLDNFLLNSKNDLEESDYYRARELIGKFHEEEREESAWLWYGRICHDPVLDNI